MKIRYVGPHAEVTIAATGQTVRRRAVADVPVKVARALLQQRSWESVKEPDKEVPNG